MHKNTTIYLKSNKFHFLVGCFTCAPDSFELVYRGTWNKRQRWGLTAEWRNLITGENLHWLQVGLKHRSLQIAWPANCNISQYNAFTACQCC